MPGSRSGSGSSGGSKRGFAAMSSEKQREIASKGGKASRGGGRTAGSGRGGGGGSNSGGGSR